MRSTLGPFLGHSELIFAYEGDHEATLGPILGLVFEFEGDFGGTLAPLWD